MKLRRAATLLANNPALATYPALLRREDPTDKDQNRKRKRDEPFLALAFRLFSVLQNEFRHLHALVGDFSQDHS